MSPFAMHYEDNALFSINVLYQGAPKLWYVCLRSFIFGSCGTLGPHEGARMCVCARARMCVCACARMCKMNACVR
jgi:hypothetical protein